VARVIVWHAACAADPGIDPKDQTDCHPLCHTPSAGCCVPPTTAACVPFHVAAVQHAPWASALHIYTQLLRLFHSLSCIHTQHRPAELLERVTASCQHVANSITQNSQSMCHDRAASQSCTSKVCGRSGMPYMVCADHSSHPSSRLTFTEWSVPSVSDTVRGGHTGALYQGCGCLGPSAKTVVRWSPHMTQSPNLVLKADICRPPEGPMRLSGPLRGHHHAPLCCIVIFCCCIQPRVEHPALQLHIMVGRPARTGSALFSLTPWTELEQERLLY
jgi:hypothetical protein